jgi:hypothetical protein
MSNLDEIEVYSDRPGEEGSIGFCPKEREKALIFCFTQCKQFKYLGRLFNRSYERCHINRTTILNDTNVEGISLFWNADKLTNLGYRTCYSDEGVFVGLTCVFLHTESHRKFLFTVFYTVVETHDPRNGIGLSFLSKLKLQFAHENYHMEIDLIHPLSEPDTLKYNFYKNDHYGKRATDLWVKWAKEGLAAVNARITASLSKNKRKIDEICAAYEKKKTENNYQWYALNEQLSLLQQNRNTETMTFISTLRDAVTSILLPPSRKTDPQFMSEDELLTVLREATAAASLVDLSKLLEQRDVCKARIEKLEKEAEEIKSKRQKRLPQKELEEGCAIEIKDLLVAEGLEPDLKRRIDILREWIKEHPEMCPSCTRKFSVRNDGSIVKHRLVGYCDGSRVYDRCTTDDHEPNFDVEQDRILTRSFPEYCLHHITELP